MRFITNNKRWESSAFPRKQPGASVESGAAAAVSRRERRVLTPWFTSQQESADRNTDSASSGSSPPDSGAGYSETHPRPRVRNEPVTVSERQPDAGDPFITNAKLSGFNYLQVNKRCNKLQTDHIPSITSVWAVTTATYHSHSTVTEGHE